MCVFGVIVYVCVGVFGKCVYVCVWECVCVCLRVCVSLVQNRCQISKELQIFAR